MMNYQDDSPLSSAGFWCFPDITGEAAAADNNHLPITMFSDYSNEDLFQLVWQQGGDSGNVMMKKQPAATPDVLPEAPSVDEMASWLSAIVKGEEHPRDGDGSGWRTPPEEKERVVPSMTVKEGLGAKDTAAGNLSDKRTEKARRSHHGETHNLTEKRRRCKINERLKTLQQLVPGCDKSNHASTLEHTVQYVKWLQHQVQAMPPTTAVYPVAPPPAGVAPVVLGTLPMVPFRPMMPCAAHYPGPAVLVPPLYPPPAAAPVPGSAQAMVGGGGGANQPRHRSSRNRLNRSRSLQHKA